MKKLNFISILIEGFRNYSQPFHFFFKNPGVNLIRGDNGTGKTTIFDAFVWCLYGITLKETTLSEVVTWKEYRDNKWRGTRVIVRLNIDDIEYDIVRHIQFKGETLLHTQGGDSLMIFKNGTFINEERSKTDTQEMINEVLGINSKTFINSILFGQRVKRLIEQDNTEKRELFETLFETEFISVARNKAIKDLTNINSILNDDLLHTAKYQTTITQIKNDLEADKIRQEQFEENKKIRKTSATNQIETYKQSININEKAITEFKIKLGGLIHNDPETMDNLKTQLKNIQTEITTAKENGGRDVRALTELSNIKKAIIDLDKKIKDVSEICPTCGQALNKERINRTKESLKLQGQEYINSLINNSVVGLGAKILPDITYLDQLSKMLEVINECIDFNENEQSKLTIEYDKIKNELDIIHRDELSYVSMTARMEQLKQYNINNEDNIKVLEESIEKIDIENPPVSHIKEYIDELQTLELKMDQIKFQIDENNRIKTKLDWWINKGFSSQGLPSYIFRNMLDSLNALTSKYGERLGIAVEFTVDLNKASKPFTTRCSIDEIEDKPYGSFSGGQKQRIDIVLIFAMFDLISSNISSNILILDEVFEGLDEAGQQAVYDLILLKSKEVQFIYVITHLQELSGLYSSVIDMNNIKEARNKLLRSKQRSIQT